MTDRSQEGLKPGQQLYGVIEFCNSTEALFAKVDSGHYDWLGVRRDKSGRITYVLGRPRLGRSELTATVRSRPEGLASGGHRVLVRAPHAFHHHANEHWYKTAEEARVAYEREKSLLLDGEGSGIFRVSLYVDGCLEDNEVVVRALPNVL